MTNFLYQSLGADGQSHSGVIAADTRIEALHQLAQRGQTATLLEASGVAADLLTGGSGSPARLLSRSLLGRSQRRPSISRSELATFIRELATAIEAGLPLMQSLRTVRRQATGKAMPQILDHLITQVEAGEPLHKAAADYGMPFTDMVVGMLRAADASGEVSSVMHQLADLLERSVELRREITGATMYPMIVFGLLISSVIILVTVLIPRLIGPLSANPDFVMPLPTAILLAIAGFIQAWWLPGILSILLAAVGWKTWSSKPANRLRLDRLKLSAPLIGRLQRDVAVARFTRTLGTLTSAGLPILEALRITKNTLGNTALSSAIDAVEDQITAGKPLAEPLEECGLFPPLLVQVVSLGERSGRLEPMLMHAAGAFDRRVNTSIKIFTKALPPVLLIIMACLGGCVLAGVLLPVIEMSSLMG